MTTPTPKQKIERLVEELEKEARVAKRRYRKYQTDNLFELADRCHTAVCVHKLHLNRLREIPKEWE